MMSRTYRPRGHLQVNLDANGRTRAFWAFWREEDNSKRGRRLTHVAEIIDEKGTVLARSRGVFKIIDPERIFGPRL